MNVWHCQKNSSPVAGCKYMVPPIYNIEKYRYKFKENGKSPGELRSKPSAGKPLGWGGVDIKKEGIKPSPFSLGSVRDAIFTNQAAETASLVQF